MKHTLLILIAMLIQFTASAQMPKRLADLPSIESGKPEAGKFVSVTEPEYKGTLVHHCVYLPTNYNKHKSYPVIVEYTGNKWKYGNGTVEEAHLGYCATLGKDFIWIVLPYINADKTANCEKWWGNEEATAAYARMVIPRIIKQYHGEKENVILCGFSRGSIAASYIGLHDDKTAKLWSAFFTHDHFDGQREWKGTYWGFPLAEYRNKASERLKRAYGKKWYVSFHGEQSDYETPINEMINRDSIGITYAPLKIDERFPTIPNEYFKHPHNDCWPLFDIPESKRLRDWLKSVTSKKR